MGLSLGHQVAQNLPMPFARIQEGNHGTFEPVRNNGCGLSKGKGVFTKSRVCTNAQESEERHPREPNWFRFRKSSFEPAASCLVMNRSSVGSIEQEIGIDENHRYKGPSACSMSSQTLS